MAPSKIQGIIVPYLGSLMHVGILGGSFDPVHFGHLHLAISLFEKHQLDEVWWIPVRQSPLKPSPLATAEHRLEMLSLALQEISAFKIVQIEIEREGPSFTVETLRTLRGANPEVQFSLFLGDDALYHFNRWKDPEEIIQLAPPLIGARHSPHFPQLTLDKELIQALQKGWTAIPLIEISATDVRKRLKDKLFCGHLVPAKVLDYIHTHRLYSST